MFVGKLMHKQDVCKHAFIMEQLFPAFVLLRLELASAGKSSSGVYFAGKRESAAQVEWNNNTWPGNEDLEFRE